MILEINNENLNSLEEIIKENVEWLHTTEEDEVECISVENLASILSKFLGRQVDFKQR